MATILDSIVNAFRSKNKTLPTDYGDDITKNLGYGLDYAPTDEIAPFKSSSGSVLDPLRKLLGTYKDPASELNSRYLLSKLQNKDVLAGDMAKLDKTQGFAAGESEKGRQFTTGRDKTQFDQSISKSLFDADIDIGKQQALMPLRDREIALTRGYGSPQDMIQGEAAQRLLRNKAAEQDLSMGEWKNLGNGFLVNLKTGAHVSAEGAHEIEVPYTDPLTKQIKYVKQWVPGSVNTMNRDLGVNLQALQQAKTGGSLTPLDTRGAGIKSWLDKVPFSPVSESFKQSPPAKETTTPTEKPKEAAKATEQKYLGPTKENFYPVSQPTWTQTPESAMNAITLPLSLAGIAKTLKNVAGSVSGKLAAKKAAKEKIVQGVDDVASPGMGISGVPAPAPAPTGFTSSGGLSKGAAALASLGLLSGAAQTQASEIGQTNEPKQPKNRVQEQDEQEVPKQPKNRAQMEDIPEVSLDGTELNEKQKLLAKMLKDKVLQDWTRKLLNPKQNLMTRPIREDYLLNNGFIQGY